MENLTRSDIELINFCLDYTKEMYKRLPLKTFLKITKGKITREQAYQEFDLVKNKLLKLK